MALLSAALNTSAGVALVEGDSSISGANAQQILAFPAAISNTSSGLDALNAEIQVRRRRKSLHQSNHVKVD